MSLLKSLPPLHIPVLTPDTKAAPWQPVINMGNDAHINTLKYDLVAFKYLAQHAGKPGLIPYNRSKKWTEDGIEITSSVYRQCHIDCMKERHPQVVN